MHYDSQNCTNEKIMSRKIRKRTDRKGKRDSENKKRRYTYESVTENKFNSQKLTYLGHV